MCNIISGHINANQESKDWGKVYLLSGIHHEEDRQNIKETKLIAWETVSPYIYKYGFRFTHDCGLSIDDKTLQMLMELLEKWAKNNPAEDIIREKFIAVSINGKKTEAYTLSVEDKTIIVNNDNCSIIAPLLSEFYITAGDYSTITAGGYSTIVSGRGSTITAGYHSTIKAGDHSTIIISGAECNIVISGKQILLTQLYYERCCHVRKVIDLDQVNGEKYKKGDVINIVKGEIK